MCCGSLHRRRISSTDAEPFQNTRRFDPGTEESKMNSVIYLIGLVVVVLAILSFLGLN
jgi:hypothetical protein